MGDANTDSGIVIDEYSRQKEIILEKVSHGIPFKYACLLAGISRATGFRLKALQGNEIERLGILEKQNIWTPEESNELEKLRMRKSLCETFETQVEAARAAYLETMVTRINLGAIKTPSAAMEILRTQFPDEFNVAKKIDHSGEVVTGAKELADTLQRIYDEEDAKSESEEGNQGASQ